MIYRFRGLWFIILTFLIAFMLDILPLPGVTVWFRPEWTLLVLMYWVLALPMMISVTSAFCVGIFLDLLQGSLLGEHALAFIVVSYLIVKVYQQIRVYPMIQQTGVIFFLILFCQLIIFIVQGIIGELPHTFLYWLPVITSTVLWPWVFTLLRDFRRRLGLTHK